MVSNKPKTVPQYLLLGASGTLGSAIIRECEAQEVELIAKTHDSLDLNDHAEVRRQIRLLRPELVVNASAYTDVMGAEQSPFECWNTNVKAFDNLVKVCAAEDRPLIHFSSSLVFGSPLGNTPRVESDPLCPQGVYARSKVCSETSLLGLGQMVCPEFWGRGFRYWLIRTSHLFGPAHLDRHRNRFARQYDLATRKAGVEVPVPSDVYRSITYAPHLARTVVWLMQNYREVVSGVYHICNRGYASLYEIFNSIPSEGPRPRFRPARRNEVAKVQDFNPELVPYYAGLNCDKWHEIAPFPMPTLQEALYDFAASLTLN